MNALQFALDFSQRLPATAQARIADGMQRADEHADERWKHIFDAAVLLAAQKHRELTSDEVLAEIERMPNAPATHNLAAIGPAMKRAAQMGILRRTERFCRSKRPEKNGNLTLFGRATTGAERSHAMPDRPVMRYFGGKWRIAPWIIAHFPPHRVYTEPFGGAASVLMRKPRAYAEVYNDLSESVVNVFRVLRDPASAGALKRRVELTPYARAEFEESEWAEVEDVEDPVERARRTAFRACAAFGSTGVSSPRKTGFRSDTSREGVIPAHDWVNWAKEIDAFTQRLRGVVIERRNALEVIQAHDSTQTLHYIDPPYVHSVRTRRASGDYAYEMTDGQHEVLAETLHGVRGMVVVSGYPSELYDRLYRGWVQRFHVATTVLGAKRTECLWMNRAAAQHSPQRRLDWDIECTI